MLFNIDTEMDNYRTKLESLLQLYENRNALSERDKDSAVSLSEQFVEKGALSYKQWDFVNSLNSVISNKKPVYGNFNAVHVMFRLAGESLKQPKIRLLTEDDIFVQLNFNTENKNITIYRDGWQGHGKRKQVGYITNDEIYPTHPQNMTESIHMVIQEFSLNPMATAVAMSHKLGACMYCGRRLSDDHSKKLGYGKTCAKHYGLEY